MRGHGFAERMARGFFESGEHGARFGGVGPVGPYNLADAGVALGEGAGFVEEHGVDAACGLDAVGVADKYSVLGGASDAYHKCCRRGQPEGARACDYEDGDGGEHAADKPSGGVTYHPHGECRESHGYNHGHEYGGHFVDEVLHGRPRALRGLDHANDAGEEGVGAGDESAVCE